MEDLLSSGTIEGEFVVWDNPVYARLVRKYRKRKPGLGDSIERILKPIAKALDKIFGTHFMSCNSCGRRKRWLNSLFK